MKHRVDFIYFVAENRVNPEVHSRTVVGREHPLGV